MGTDKEMPPMKRALFPFVMSTALKERCGDGVHVNVVADHDPEGRFVYSVLIATTTYRQDQLTPELVELMDDTGAANYIEAAVTEFVTALRAEADRLEKPSGDQRPHSRACGIVSHQHGPACHTNCPTCHGQ